MLRSGGDLGGGRVHLQTRALHRADELRKFINHLVVRRAELVGRRLRRHRHGEIALRDAGVHHRDFGQNSAHARKAAGELTDFIGAARDIGQFHLGIARGDLLGGARDLAQRQRDIPRHQQTHNQQQHARHRRADHDDEFDPVRAVRSLLRAHVQQSQLDGSHVSCGRADIVHRLLALACLKKRRGFLTFIIAAQGDRLGERLRLGRHRRLQFDDEGLLRGIVFGECAQAFDDRRHQRDRRRIRREIFVLARQHITALVGLGIHHLQLHLADLLQHLAGVALQRRVVQQVLHAEIRRTADQRQQQQRDQVTEQDFFANGPVHDDGMGFA